jgi:hypothetical protein
MSSQVKDKKGFRQAPFGGDDTLLRPPILRDRIAGEPDTGIVHAGSQYYFVTGRGFIVYRWDGTEVADLHGSGGGSFEQWVGPTLLLSYAGSQIYAVTRWTEHDGVRVLVGFGSDDSRGAALPSSDGKDLVWIQGEGRYGGGARFPETWVMTSKFSTEPSEIKPRRLTRWVSDRIVSTTPSQVGCGRAVFPYVLEENGITTGTGLFIVRLSDGVSWTLHDPYGPESADWNGPIAITCNEVFAKHSRGFKYTIRRVRLDSLGPGTPPSD